MYTVYDIANWFLANVESVTNKKLQKLVYYAYAWFLVFNNKIAEDIELRFFDAHFEAWVHGAARPELYDKYKEYGSSNIQKYVGELADFSADELEVLNQVCDIYGKYNGNELESICCQEDPWKNARKDLNNYELSTNKITDSDIFNYYIKKVFKVQND